MTTYDSTLIGLARRSGGLQALVNPRSRAEVRLARSLRKQAKARVTRHGWSD